MNENTNCNVSIQDAKILCDMCYISNEEFNYYLQSRAAMVREAAKQYKESVAQSFPDYANEEAGLSSNVLN